MRRDPRRVEPRLRHDLLQLQKERLPRQRAARVPAREKPLARLRQDRPQSLRRLSRGLRQRHDAVLAALAAHHQHLGVHGQRHLRQSQQFRYAQPARVEDFQAGAHRETCTALGLGGCPQQQVDLGLGQVLRQGPARLGRIEQPGGVLWPHPFAQQELVELTDGGEAPGLGARREPLSRERGEIGAQIVALRQRQRPSPRGQERAEILEVGTVGRERVPRRTTLGGHHFDKGFEVSIHQARGVKVRIHGMISSGRSAGRMSASLVQRAGC